MRAPNAGARGAGGAGGAVHSRKGGVMRGVHAVPVLAFSDFACPFCYVAEAMLRQREEAGRAAVMYRAFELYPAPAPVPPPAAWPEALVRLAAVAGVAPAQPTLRPRTAKAHELVYLAREAGREAEVRRALHAAYWREGRDIGRIDVLVAVAGDLGFDAGLVKATLDVDRYTAHVARDREAATRLGIDGVPAAVLGTGTGALLLLGAQPADVLDDAIQQLSETL